MLEDLFGPAEERGFTVRYWDGEEEGTAGEAASDFVLVLRHPGALRQAFLPPTDRSMALAFGRSHVDVEGDLEAAAGLADAGSSKGGRLGRAGRSASLFTRGKLGVVQMLWGKPEADGHLPLPRTRADLYAPALGAGPQATVTSSHR